jgi:transcriptional regulator with XRE-family HTH domain
MGSARPRPQRLAEKLLMIRQIFGVSQGELIRLMRLEDELEQERISKYERGVLEPPLHILAAYADVANIYVEVLIKDDLDLPETLPSRKKSEGIKRQK